MPSNAGAVPALEALFRDDNHLSNLTHVDLSWNTLNEAACTAIGAAMLANEASRVTG